MLEEFSKDLLIHLKKSLYTSETKKIIYELIHYFLYPAKYVISLLILLIIITFIMGVINMYFTYRSYVCLLKKLS